MGIIQVPISRERSGSLHPDNVDVEDKGILFVNRLTRSTEDMEKVTKYIKSEHDGDFEIMPQCTCGAVCGPYLKVSGIVCLICNTKATLRCEQSLKPILYLTRPIGVTKMILPNVWFMMMDLLSQTSSNPFNTLLYLTDTTYTYDGKNANRKRDHAKFLIELHEAVGPERGWNYFINNMGRILTGLANMKFLRNNPAGRYMVEYYHKHKDDFLVDNLYVIHKSLVVLDKNATGKYMDPKMKTSQIAILSMIGIDVMDGMNPTKRGNLVARFINNIAMFYSVYISKRFNSKKGLWKKHMFNMKGIHIARAVIISKVGPHEHSNIGIPWTIGVMLLEQFIVSKLLHMGYTMNEAKAIHHKYIHIYSKGLHDIVKQILADTPAGRMHIMFQRFPTLTQGSMLRMWFDDIKTNPKDHTFDLSILVVRSLNADFDGDYGHGGLLPDTLSAETWEPFDYHYNIMNPMRYRQISGNLSLSVQTIINYQTWREESFINACEDENKLNHMYELLG